MAKQIVVGLFQDHAAAEQAVDNLVKAGFDRGQISVIANDAQGQCRKYKASDPAATAGTEPGGAVGAAVGAGLGALLGLAWLAVPGIGPVMTAGQIAAAVLLGAAAGAATGGVIGALTSMGVSEADANAYAECIRRGGTLVSVISDEARAKEAAAIMDAADAVDMDRQTAALRSEGWTGFDPNAKPWAESGSTSSTASAPASAAAASGQRQSQQPGSQEQTPATTGQTSDQSDDDVPTVVVVEEEFVVGEIPVALGGARTYSQAGQRAGDQAAPGQDADAFAEELARDQRYRNRDWSSMEPDARRSFEQRYPGSTWDQVKEKVRRGYEKVREKIS